MYLPPYVTKGKQICNFYYLSTRSITRRTHYDVLNLSRNCTSKEIKESFIKLSKQNHPDLNKSTDAHKNFLAINESYKVLSNAETRRNYDLGLMPNNESSSGPEIYRKYRRNAWSDPTFYSNRNKNKDTFYERQPYYGIKGQQRISNIKIVLICICLTIFIVGLQFVAIAKSVTFQRDVLIRQSQEAQDSLKQLKKTVNENGNEAQLELLKLKFAEKNGNKKM